MLFALPRHAARIQTAVFLALAFLLLAPVGVLAQTDSALQQSRERIETIVRTVGTFEQTVRAAGNNDASLVEARLEAEQAAKELLETAAELSPRLGEINARLDQLGPAPAEGQPPEPAAIAEERQDLIAQKALINEIIGKAESGSVEANRLIEEVNLKRRELFTETLTRRFDLDDQLAGETLADFRTELRKLWSSIENWLRFAITFKFNAVLLATTLALLAAAVLLVGVRRVFGSLYEADPEIDDPSYLSRLSVAFWSTFLPSMAFAIFLGVVYLLLESLELLRVRIDTILVATMATAGVIYFVNRLARSVLSPSLPNWRLVPFQTRAARLLVWLVTATAVASGFDYLTSTINDVMKSPFSLTVAKSLIATLAVGILLILVAVVRPFIGEEGARRPWPTYIRIILWVLGGVTVVAALLGYIGFASFLSQQIVLTGAILATMYLGFLSARAVGEQEAFANTGVGRRLKGHFDIDDTRLDQFGVVASILVKLLVVLIGAPMILVQWGVRPEELLNWSYKLLTGITIGSVTLSLTGVLSGLVVFAVSYIAFRWFIAWLDSDVLARGRLDSGVRTSIKTAVGYLGIAVAVLLGISAAGFNLSSLALVAGGLSLGIGFGLQNIVSNFVSGLILLAERPFKAGDWIVAGTTQGTVKKVSVRATEIETFQRQTIIMPNSDLINSAVGNWTHRNHLGRVEVPVGVSYGSDPHQVREILLDIGRNHPMALKNPEPYVLFSDFGASSLDFELRLFIADILNIITVTTDIRFQIFDRFKEADIEIPFPQQDVHIKSVQTVAQPDVLIDQTETSEVPARRGRQRDGDQ